MDNDKENILKLFKSGATIASLTDMLYSQHRDKEREKRASERVKIDKRDIKNMVEKTIYEDYMNHVSEV